MKKLLEDPKRVLLISISIIIIVVLIYYLLRKLKKSEDLKLINSVDKEIDKSNLSFSNSEYLILADRLDTAMRGLGTDEDTIYNVLNLLNNSDDWLKLVTSFGIREYGNWVSTKQGTLPHWLDSELDTSEKAKVRNILLKIGVMF